ncbi:MAG TPA: alpha/beta hydrolase [Candidatus Saccharimonadales bacterium]|nr:alpha/beta hydrolase [Candidatus Saccharimonadales bacterium]
MAYHFWDTFWHKAFGRPYRLAKPLDAGSGQPVVLLHGIGRTGQTWQNVVNLLADRPYRLVAFDLLGFGASPKPEWPQYDIDDHAKAVIASIEKLRFGQPAVLVGHSMGCLVSVRVARLRPDLVRHLVLYEMPLYEGLPEKRRYRARLSLYYRFYNRILQFQPSFDPANAKLIERWARRIAGFEVDRETWRPFVKSLEHSIMQQTAADDFKHIAMPIDVIYGSRDMLVIRGKIQHIFGENHDHVTAHTIRERHVISEKASRFIVARILAVDAVQEAPDA